jgi:prephenate dehydratase
MAHWKILPEAAKSSVVELEFLTTHDELKKAGTVKKLAADAVTIPVHNVAEGTVLAQLNLEKLGQIYRNEHNLEVLKNTVKPLATALG